MEEIKIISELSFLELVDFGSKDFQLFKAERFQVNWFLFSRRSKEASIILNETLLSNITNHNTLIALV